MHEAQHEGRWETEEMTMKDVDGNMVIWEENMGGGNAKRREGSKTERRERARLDVERGSSAARLIAVDLHDKLSRQLVTKVALQH